MKKAAAAAGLAAATALWVHLRWIRRHAFRSGATRDKA
jgi:hypothetical protein